MNKEGYRDPTAEKAVYNVSRAEQTVTKKQLIDACWREPSTNRCYNCTYDEECNEFMRMTGHAPIYYQKGSSEYTSERIIPKKRRKY